MEILKKNWFDKHKRWNGFFAKILRFENDNEYIKNEFNILDFGCGDCTTFDIIRRKYQEAHLTGFEIDKRAVNIAKNKGYNVYTSLKDINHIENKFDCILMLQVIEHLKKHQIYEFFDFTKKHLKKDGIIIVSSVNTREFFSLRDFWDNIDHKYPISLKAINQLCQIYNYKQLKIIKKCPRLNPFKILINIMLGDDIYTGWFVVLKKEK